MDADPGEYVVVLVREFKATARAFHCHAGGDDRPDLCVESAFENPGQLAGFVLVDMCMKIDEHEWSQGTFISGCHGSGQVTPLPFRSRLQSFWGSDASMRSVH